MDNKVYLTNTDTTIGFISQDAATLTKIKKRPLFKQYIKAVDSLSTLKSFARIPRKYKNMVRRASKTTFILQNGESYRVIKDKHHLKLISRLKWAYTTSANISGKEYDEKWARSAADEVIEPIDADRKKPSSIYKLGKKRVLKIR